MSQVQTASTDFAYLDYRKIKSRPHYAYLWPAVVRQMQERLPLGAAVLDAGCGNGEFCKHISADFNVSGFDMSPSGIGLARERTPEVRFEIASGYNDFRTLFGTTFDAVLSLEVIEHLYAPRTYVERVRDALCSDGLFILSTPYHGYLKNLAIALTGKFDGHFNPLFDGGHIKFWSRQTLSDLLEEFGFRVLHFEGVGRYPLLWKSMVLVAQKQ